MTAIAGLARNGAVYLAGDSAGVSGYSLVTRADTKVFTNGPFALGFTSSFRMGQLLRHALTAPEPPTDPADLDRFMTTTFIDAVRTTLRDGGWLAKNSDREDGGTFLVGVSGRLFTVCDDFQVAEAACGYAAIGCGHELALGALYATAGTRKGPQRRLRTALEAAAAFSAGVRGPFAYACTPQEART